MWFRRDLRLEDNHALYKALSSEFEVIPIFIFDKNILSLFSDKKDRRVNFIHERLKELKSKLEENGSTLLTSFSTPLKAFESIINKYDIEAVYSNEDYEPYARRRDNEVSDLLFKNDIDFFQFKDHLIFSKDEIMKADASPYTVFTPYKKKWLSNFDKKLLTPYPSEKHLKNLAKLPTSELVSLEKMKFQAIEFDFPKIEINKEKLKDYDKHRDFPHLDATSLQGIHLRFGTLSIRQYVKQAIDINDTWLSELIWREFFSQILYHFPKVINSEFKEKYSSIPWKNEEDASDEIMKWKQGKTGYPIVDAGMRELQETGHMHNRVRMVCASFLIKHLLVDWRIGEKHFASLLLDYDLASNNGNWQWAAGCGCDAAPYFRVFNPTSQQEKFDKEFKYIKKWVPEFGTDKYPEPMVDHKQARELCLKTYKENLS